MDLGNTVSIVTGGTGGLGGVICTQLAEAGSNIALVYRSSTELAEERVAALRALGRQAIAIQADVSTESGAATMAQATFDAFGRIDVLVNNAAFNKYVAFTDLDGLTDDLWNFILTTNLTGPFRCIKAVAPVMKRQGQGRIINVSSVAGVQAGGSSIAYAVSKSGLNHLTRCMAMALAPEILINSVSPGLMEGTRMTGNLHPDQVKRARETALLKRAAHKEDVAAQIVAFAANDSITGQTIVIDAGRVFH